MHAAVVPVPKGSLPPPQVASIFGPPDVRWRGLGFADNAQDHRAGAKSLRKMLAVARQGKRHAHDNLRPGPTTLHRGCCCVIRWLTLHSLSSEPTDDG